MTFKKVQGQTHSDNNNWIVFILKTKVQNIDKKHIYINIFFCSGKELDRGRGWLKKPITKTVYTVKNTLKVDIYNIHTFL
jgi:hypothetical protein